MFWPSFFGIALLVIAVAAPFLARRRTKGAFALSLGPAAFILGCFAVSEGRQALLEARMSRVEANWSASRVESLLGPPDHVFPPGSLFPPFKSYGAGNQTPVWSYVPPRLRGWLRITDEFPWFRFRSGLDSLREVLVGGIFGLPQGGFILQMGKDGRVLRKGSWE